jgi:hypothetical protein
MPVHPNGEPFQMDPTLLKGAQLRARRASLSILTHNDIIIGEEGIVARGTEDIEELGGEDASLVEDYNSAAFENQLFNSLDPLSAVSFPSLDDLSFFTPDMSFVQMDDTLNAPQFGRMEDWIEELLGSNLT